MTPAPEVTVDELAALPEGTPLLDVREDDEWDAGHVAGSAHVPLQQLPERLDEVPEPTGEAPLVVVCRSGHRSAHAAAWLQAQGRRAVNLVGGLQAWQAAGRPLQDGAGGAGHVA